MLKNVTIIIFTRNRFAKASVVVRFWLRHGSRVLLLDASTNSDLEEEFAMEKNVVYFRGNSFWERALFASNNIGTLYSLIHSDDSLVFPSTVREGITVLEKNREIGYLYGPGNFTSWWFENSSWEYSDKMSGESSFDRMIYWAEKPNDLMWGALWRSNHLRKALKIWGESMKIFPFESGLHTTSLYLAGAALTSGQSLSGPLHLSRHWLAPIDETLKIARSVKSPFGIDLNDPENQRMFDLWRTRLLDGINEQLESKERITLGDLDFLLKLYEEREPNLGLKLYGNIGLKQRLREKILIELMKVAKEKSFLSSTAGVILMLTKQFRLIKNYLNRRRCGWFRSRMISDFTEYELLQFGIETKEFSLMRLKNYHKLFAK